MITCDRLHEFFAGELTPSEADAMREHLGTCVRCGTELRQLMLEAAVTAAAGGKQGLLRFPLGSHTHAAVRRPWAGVVRWGTLGAGFAVMLLVGLRVLHRPAEQAIAFDLGLAPTRGVDVRFTLSAADRHRPYDVARSASARTRGEPIKAETLYRVDKSGDKRGLAALEALRGEFASATQTLANAPEDARTRSDKAALYILDGDSQRALSLAASAARESVPQASWNEAVALENLRLPLAAAVRFDRVALAREPGWADEAAHRAAALRAAHARETMEWKMAQRVGEALVEGGPPASDELVAQQPGVLRDALYDAIRVAASPERLQQLLPMAEALDRLQGKSSMADHVRRTMAADLTARAKLAGDYRRLRLASGKLDATAAEGLLAAARSRHQDDIVLGTLLWLDKGGLMNDARRLEMRTLARSSPDPLQVMIVAQRLAWHLTYAERRPAAVLAEIEPALKVCEAQPIPDICSSLEYMVATAHSDRHREDLAQTHLARALTLAAESRDPSTKRRAFYAAGEVTLDRTALDLDSIVLGDAYFEENALRTDDCQRALFRHSMVAQALLRRNLRAAAAEHMAQARALKLSGCTKEAPRLNEAEISARLLQHDGSPAEVEVLRRSIADLRREVSTGEQAFLDLLEGRLLIERSPQVGLSLLHAAIQKGRDRDDSGRGAATTSETVLFLDAVRRGDPEGSIGVIAEAWRTPPPVRCAVALAGEDRAGVVVVGADGEAKGSYRPVPAGTVALAPAERIPDALRGALASCEDVEVFALGTYYGASGILPPETTWHYRSRKGMGSGGGLQSGPQVIVADVNPPSTAGLPSLHVDLDGGNATALIGAGATPRRVLAQIADAAAIEIHAHGVIDNSDQGGPALALSPDADGAYLLGAERIAGQRLRRHPIVLLAACDAGRSSGGPDGWGLSEAFLEAGASAVIAAPSEIKNVGAGVVFGALRRRIAGGESPAAALRAERMGRAAASPWILDLVVFQ